MTTTQTNLPPLPTRLPFLGSRSSLPPKLHRLTDDPIGRTLAADPRWRAAAWGLAQYASAFELPPAETPETMADDLLEELLAGGTIPGDLVDRINRAAVADTARSIAVQAERRLGAMLVAEIDAAALAVVPAMLKALDEDLQAALDTARAISNRKQLTSAEAAFGAQRFDEFDTLRSVYATHARLRRDQQLILAATGVTIPHAEAFYVANIEAAFPQWKPWRAFGFLIGTQGRQLPIVPPWTDRDHPGDTWSTWAASDAFLTWALDHDADLRIATLAEAKAEAERLAGVLTGPPVPGVMDAGEPFVDPARA